VSVEFKVLFWKLQKKIYKNFSENKNLSSAKIYWKFVLLNKNKEA